MSPYKLAAFDMDGTLLNSRKEIQQSAAAAFQRAVQADKILALNTGRAISELLLYPIREMGIQYGSCACGTIIYDFREDRILADRTIPQDMIPLIVAASREEDLMFQVIANGISHVEKAFVPRMSCYQMGVYQPLFETAAAYVEDVRAFALAHADQINKINLFHTDPESRERTGKRLSGLPLDITYAETTSFELTPQGVTKGTGLQDLCRVLEIPLAQAIGVGDAFNDIPMLQAAGLGAAMGNSNQAALEAADVVVGDNDHDGIAEVIDRYLIGGQTPAG